MRKHIDLSRALARHVVGTHHTLGHRMLCGIVIMVFGVGTAKASVLVHSMPLHMGLDLVGYLIHAIGAIPFIEHLISEDSPEHLKE